MSDICPICGLPKELCVCGEIAKETQKIVIKTEVKKYRKKVTVIENLQGIDLDELAAKLKRKMACGGTVKNKRIELQGAHAEKVKKALIELNYPEGSIEII
ncbi:MAG: stress response translation initiation inhibitor YciH [Candidatus Diapherotrites archaeon]|nr:stress response translation initiation inhibitor YciH [Candidatus Diapherotrites archaeon]